MTDFNVIVVGLGGMGSAATYQLAKRGLRALGLEQYTLNHPMGSSYGHSRVIRQAYFESPAYVPLIQRAYELWQQLQEESGESILRITGGLMLGEPASAVYRGSLDSAIEHSLNHEVLDANAIRSRFPELTPTDELGMFEQIAGIIRPERAIDAHLSIAQQNDAELHFEEPILDWKSDSKSVVVRTQKREYSASKLVLTVGAWAPQFFGLELPLRVTQQTLFWFEPFSGFDLFRPPHFPVYIWQVSQDSEIYGFPWLALPGEPRGVKVAFFYRDLVIDPNSIRTPVESHEIDEMRDVLRTRIPNLPGKLVHAQRCLYTETPDHHFIIDRHPEYPNVILASPCSGHGYKFCSVVGEILADLVERDASRHSLDLFSIDRFRCFGTIGTN